MSKLHGKVKVRPHVWRDEGGNATPVLRIFGGSNFVVIRFDQARRLVDAVHDACDARDRERRAQGLEIDT